MSTAKLILKNQKIDRIFDLMAISQTLKLTYLLEEIYLLLKESLNLENVMLIYEKAIKYDRTRIAITSTIIATSIQLNLLNL